MKKEGKMSGGNTGKERTVKGKTGKFRVSSHLREMIKESRIVAAMYGHDLRFHHYLVFAIGECRNCDAQVFIRRGDINEDDIYSTCPGDTYDQYNK
ncbi:hypothetical protein ACFLXL_00085 [Chloroflexota bacterium]